MRQLIAILLSLGLGLFLADAVISLADDSLILFFNFHVLAGLRGIIFFFTFLMAVLIYGLMGFTPMIPKRLFLPVTLFSPAAFLFVIPFVIYCYSRIQQVAWIVSFGQVICALGILYLVEGGFKFHWRLFPEKRLEPRSFSWWNLLVFLLMNAFVLLPVVIFYLVFCSALGVDHFSDGFMKLRPGGLSVQMRKYVRDDGKTIQLFPMSHIAEPDFYRKVSQSFPTNSIILLEGVTDTKNLLTNKISYKRMATSLGLAEQQKVFQPSQGEQVRADVDVDQFASSTIDLLNFVMLIHSKGLSAENLSKLLQYPASPGFEDQLLEDLLRKRNRHLLEVIHSRLSQTDHIIVPWGVAHMPEIAKEIQKSGFRLEETSEYMNIRFGSDKTKNNHTGENGDFEKTK